MSLHADALATLTRWSAPDPAQGMMRAVFTDHLGDRPDALARDCHPDHVTASVLIFSHDHRRVLLTLHRRIGRWLQTGGHCEPTDTRLAGAALREGREESGIDDLRIDPEPVWLSRHEVHCGPLRPSHHLDVQFVAVASPGAVHIISDESADLQWFDTVALPREADASVHELTAAGARRLRGNP